MGLFVAPAENSSCFDPKALPIFIFAEILETKEDVFKKDTFNELTS
jgi:hypothetical protein